LAYPRALVAAPIAALARRAGGLVPGRGGRPAAPGSVLVLCIYRSRHADTVDALVSEARARGWEVRLWALDDVAPSLAWATVGHGTGAKFPLLNGMLRAHDVEHFDWIVVADDDVTFGRRSLAELLEVADTAGLDFVQPAHTELSHRKLEFTVRRPLSLARRTTFVEIGPLFAVRRPWTVRVLPFPSEHTMGWGLELEWHDLERDGMRLGIVDGVPLRHLSPVGKSYAKDDERARLRALLDARGLESVLEVQHTKAVWRPWQSPPGWRQSS
jgi:hypothetical protein